MICAFDAYRSEPEDMRCSRAHTRALSLSEVAPTPAIRYWCLQFQDSEGVRGSAEGMQGTPTGNVQSRKSYALQIGTPAPAYITICGNGATLSATIFRGAGSSPILLRNLLLMHFDSSRSSVRDGARQEDRGDGLTNQVVDRFPGSGQEREAAICVRFRRSSGSTGVPLDDQSRAKAAHSYDPFTGTEL